MGGYGMPNPYTGSGWTNPIQGGSSSNPVGLGGGPGVAAPGGPGPTPGGLSPGNIFGNGSLAAIGDPFALGGLFGGLFGGNPPPNPQASPTASGGPWGNPGGYQNPWGANEIQRNVGLNNILAGQMRNQLIPEFANAMGQYGGAAGNFYGQLMNLGSPFYQQKQQEAFTQGNQQNQNAMAQAQQQLGAQGYGYTPSGANAAMIGGMAQQGSQNLAEQYLQNLFQNEQMQMQGAQGMAGLAGMFNPAQLTGQNTSQGGNINIPSNFFQNFQQMGQGMSQMMPAAAMMAGAM